MRQSKVELGYKLGLFHSMAAIDIGGLEQRNEEKLQKTRMKRRKRGTEMNRGRRRKGEGNESEEGTVECVVHLKL